MASYPWGMQIPVVDRMSRKVFGSQSHLIEECKIKQLLREELKVAENFLEKLIFWQVGLKEDDTTVLTKSIRKKELLVDRSQTVI